MLEICLSPSTENTLESRSGKGKRGMSTTQMIVAEAEVRLAAMADLDMWLG